MKWIKIIAMSKNLKDIKRDLGDGRSVKFADHCCKIIVTNGRVYFEHWTNEIYGFCSWIMTTTIKPDNRKIDLKMINEYFFGSCCDTLNTFKICLKLQNSIENKNNKWDESNDEVLFENYRNFCKQIAIYLNKNILTPNDVRDFAIKYLIK